MRLAAVPSSIPAGEVRPPSKDETRRNCGGETMGTTWRVDLHSSRMESVGEVRHTVAEVLERLVGQMSHYRPDSDLGRFNRARGAQWVNLPVEMFHVLDTALSVALETEGAFDPTLGHLVNSWGFGPNGPTGTPPDAQAVLDGLFRRGWSRLLLDPARGRAWQPGGVSVDFSSIAKGFAVDQVARVLDDFGIANFLVEIGGELRSRGVKSGGHPWWVAIEQPPDCEGFPEVVVALCGQAVATSGDYRRYFMHDGVRYSHTIDPRTGKPVRGDLASVTVIHDQCILADAYSTALLVLGEAAGHLFAEKRQLPALFIARDGNGFRHSCTRAFQDMLD